MSQPLLLELDPEDADEEALFARGYLVFTTVGGLREYVARQTGEASHMGRRDQG